MIYASPLTVVLKGLVFEESFHVFVDATSEFCNFEFEVSTVGKKDRESIMNKGLWNVE